MQNMVLDNLKKYWQYVVMFVLVVYIISHRADDVIPVPYMEESYGMSYKEDSIKPRLHSTAASASGRQNANEKYMMDEGADKDVEISNDVVPNVYADTVRKIIKAINMQIESKDSNDAMLKAQKTVQDNNGFIENMNVSEYSLKKKRYYLNIRIPSDKFEIVVGEFRKIGYVKSEDMSSRDVTKVYYDNEERIKNLEAREEKVREFYNNAKNVEETLKVYAELENIREQIESLKTQNKSYDDLVNYSTITLEIIPEIESTPITEPEWNIEKVWTMAVNELVVFFRDIIEYAVYAVVFAPVWGGSILLIFIVWFIFTRRFKKKK